MSSSRFLFVVLAVVVVVGTTLFLLDDGVMISGVDAAAAAATTKSCQTITRGKRLKELVANSNVLVSLQQQPQSEEEDTSENNDDDDKTNKVKDGDATFQEICQRLESTLRHNSDDIEIVLVTDKILKRKVWDTSMDALPTTTAKSAPSSWSSFVSLMWKKFLTVTGLQRFVSSTTSSTPASTTPIPVPSYVLYKQGDEPLTGRGIRMTDPLLGLGGDDDDDSDDEHTKLAQTNADIVTEFMAYQLGRKKLGNYVYSLGAYDLMASQVVSQSSSSSVLPPIVWVKVIGPLLYYTFYPGAMSYERDIAKDYLKIANKALNDETYVDTQVSRLESMLSIESDDDTDESNTNNNKKKNMISSKQREQLSQRLHTLKRFQSPVPFDTTTVRGFLLKLLMNVLTFVAIVLLVPYLLLTDGPEEYEEYDEEEEYEGDDDQEEEEEEYDEDKDDDYDSADHSEEDVPLDDDIVDDDDDEVNDGTKDDDPIDTRNILNNTRRSGTSTST